MGMSEEYFDGSSVILGIMLVYWLICGIFSVVTYILQSLGYHTLAKRRGINNAWLSWIPFGNVWIMGCVSDQYQYVAKGKVRNKRKAMLTLSIITTVAAVIFYILYFAFIVGMVEDSMLSFTMEASVSNMLAVGLLMLLFGLILIGVSIALSVLQYIALYDLFASADPKNAVLYLVLSIVFSVTLPFFIFACRNKDGGMPPRKVNPEPPVYQPPQVEAPVYQPPQEPWENPPEE